MEVRKLIDKKWWRQFFSTNKEIFSNNLRTIKYKMPVSIKNW